MNNTLQIRQCHSGRKGASLIISNGSERGDYINCSDMQKKFSSIHDGVQIMKTYYPSDPSWTDKGRISSIKKTKASYAWDYDYDDYMPLQFDSEHGCTYRELQEVKLIGADIHLTLTMDMSLSDEELLAIFGKLKNFGRVYLRINHEANGKWFRHHKLHTYKEVSDFFVRCHNLMKIVSPEIKSVFSLTGDIFVRNEGCSIVTRKLAKIDRDNLFDALAVADYWSVDKYVSLNWGWPYSYPDNSESYFDQSVSTWWRIIEELYLLMIAENGGVMKPLFLHEFNSDSDVVGDDGQCLAIKEVYERIKESDFPWLAGICFYQYCDEGGLGLIKGSNGMYKDNPSLNTYREMLKKFSPCLTYAENQWNHKSYSFVWSDSKTAKGVAFNVPTRACRYTNNMSHNVYIVKNELWHLLLPGESIKADADSMQLFIPPNIDKGKVRHVTTVSNISELIQSSLQIDHRDYVNEI